MLQKLRLLTNVLNRISGVGVRKYYANLGYSLDGPYMSKMLDYEDEPDEEY